MYFLTNKKQVNWHLKFCHVSQWRHGDATPSDKISNVKVLNFCLLEHKKTRNSTSNFFINSLARSVGQLWSKLSRAVTVTFEVL